MDFNKILYIGSKLSLYNLILDCGLNSNKRRDALGFQFSSGNEETKIQNVSAYLKVLM